MSAGFSGSGLGWFSLILALLNTWKRRQDDGDGAPVLSRSPGLPPAPTPLILPATTPVPWPQVIPKGLPTFPGPGWTYDEPPPIEVQQRAGQLYGKLWSNGAGKHVIEQTAGRWIAYRGEIVRSGKRGVVAYRLKGKPKALPAARSAPTARRTPAARSGPVRVPVPLPDPPGPVVQRSPGMPQPPGYTQSSWVPAPGGSVDVQSPLALRTLRYGMGLQPAAAVADVRLLQDKLAIQADGRFGKGTLAAVRTFQQRNGLTPDGIVGPNTWTALFAVRA